MRKFILLFSALIIGTTGILANSTDDKVAERNAYRYNNNRSFIFVENGITFSVYRDGEFDFYIDNHIGNRRRNMTFNSGYDYSPYAQYDDYGAVIQVENVPIYYDYYGRVSQIGDVNINYRNGRVSSVGNMYVYYNRRGYYDYHTGYINVYNRYYVYRPFHSFFARPSLSLCLVFGRPYRRYYSPIRYTYYNPYSYNTRITYATVGKTHRYNSVRRERSSIYRNDKRVAVRNSSTRSNRTVARSNSRAKTNRTAASNSSTRRSSTSRSNTTRSNNRARSGRKATEATRTLRRSNVRKGVANDRKVTKREVTRTPRRTTVKRSSTTYRKPVSRMNNRSVRSITNSRTKRTVSRPAQRASRNSGITKRSSTQRSVNRTPSRSRSVSTRNSSSRSVSKAPSRSTRSVSARSSRSNSRAVTSRSRGRQ